mgnify:CR=1|tara:strand:- start:127 stop:498 length:372 start_codon:yes stop_codon:yes gene_type:complete
MPARFSILFGSMLVAAFLPLTEAKAEAPKSVQDFVEACKNGHPSFLYCIGVANGVLATMGLVGTLQGKNADSRLPAHCAPNFVSNGQAIQAFQNWAQANPKAWQLDGQYGLMIAIEQTWPCKQ